MAIGTTLYVSLQDNSRSRVLFLAGRVVSLQPAPVVERTQCALTEWNNVGRWFGHAEPLCSCAKPVTP